MNIVFEEDSSFNRVLKILMRADDSFSPPISIRTKLNDYASKLSSNAINLYVCSNGKDCGHAAFYVNDQANQIAFLSSIYLDDSIRGSGVGDQLMGLIIDSCKNRCMTEIRLAVNSKNCGAIKFYKKHGFQVVEKGDELMMYLGLS
jgi:ribosomal protein S18 acetylase RimI-like enzyme